MEFNYDNDLAEIKSVIDRPDDNNYDAELKEIKSIVRPAGKNDDDNLFQAGYHGFLSGTGNMIHTAQDALTRVAKPDYISDEDWQEKRPWLVKKISEFGHNLEDDYKRDYSPWSGNRIAYGVGGVGPYAIGLGAATVAASRTGNYKAIGEAANTVVRNANLFGKYTPQVAKAAEIVAPAATVGAIRTVPEAGIEWQGAYDDYIEEEKRNGTYVKGETEKKAEQVSNAVFRDNMALLGGTNLLETIALTTKLPLSTVKSAMVKIMGGAAMNAGEEMAQQTFPKVEAGKDWSLTDEDTLEAGLIGGLVGGGMQGAGIATDHYLGNDKPINSPQMTKEEFFDKVATQESGGNYSAQNGRTGAFGKYQIMPENWPSWSKEAGLPDGAEMTPENQEVVAQYKLGDYFDKYGAEGALVAWYSGENNAQRWVNGEADAIGEGGHYSWDAKQGKGNEPSIREYVSQALGRSSITPGNNNLDLDIPKLDNSDVDYMKMSEQENELLQDLVNEKIEIAVQDKNLDEWNFLEENKNNKEAILEKYPDIAEKFKNDTNFTLEQKQDIINFANEKANTLQDENEINAIERFIDVKDYNSIVKMFPELSREAKQNILQVSKPPSQYKPIDLQTQQRLNALTGNQPIQHIINPIQQQNQKAVQVIQDLKAAKPKSGIFKTAEEKVVENAYKSAINRGDYSKAISIAKQMGNTKMADVLSSISSNHQYENILMDIAKDKDLKLNYKKLENHIVKGIPKATKALENALNKKGVDVSKIKYSFKNNKTNEVINGLAESNNNNVSPVKQILDLASEHFGSPSKEVTKLTKREKAIADFGKKMGVPVVFFENKNAQAHGFHVNGTTFINRNSELPTNWVFWHESFHWMRNNNPELYHDMLDYFKKVFSQKQIDDYRGQLGRPELTNDEVIEEMLADYMPDVARRVGLMKQLGKDNPSLAERFVAWIRDIMDRFNEFFHSPIGLTPQQKVLSLKPFNNLVRDTLDANGNRIFRITPKEIILVRNGKPASSVLNREFVPAYSTKNTNWRNNVKQETLDKIEKVRNELNDYLKEHGETININTFERQALRQKIADELYGNGAKNKNKEVYIVIGPPAAGKSSVAEPLAKRTGGLIIDSDMAKERLPEFNNGKFAGAVHVESDYITSKLMISKAIVNSDNIVLPIVGKTYKKLVNNINNFESIGYKVHIVHVDLPINKAVERAIYRFQETGRFVDPDYIESIGYTTRENYDKIKNMEGVVSYEAFSNDISRGEKVRLLERGSTRMEKALDKFSNNITGGERSTLFKRGMAERGLARPLYGGRFQTSETRTQEKTEQTELKGDATHEAYTNDVTRGERPICIESVRKIRGKRPQKFYGDAGKSGENKSTAKEQTKINHSENEQSGIFMPKNEESQNKPKYSYVANAEHQSFIKRIMQPIMTPKGQKINKKNIKSALEDLTGCIIRSGHLDAEIQSILDTSQGIIKSKHSFDWEHILPHVGDIVAKRLNLKNDNDVMSNYIGRWLIDGAVGESNSQVARDFEKAMKKDLDFADSLTEIRCMFDDMNKRSADLQIQSTISKDNDVPIIDSVKEYLQKHYDEYIEEFGPIKRLVKDVEKKIGKNLAFGANPYLAFRLWRGRFGKAIAIIEGKHEGALRALQAYYPNVNFKNFRTLNMILSDIGVNKDKTILDKFGAYCLAKHARDLHFHNEKELVKLQQEHPKMTLEKALSKNIDGYTFYITPNEWNMKNCKATIKKYEKENPVFVQGQKDLVNVSNVTMQIMVDSGLINWKQYHERVGKWKNYVPLFREFEDNENISFGDSLKKMHGSTKNVIHPVESIINNTYKFIDMAAKNKAKNKLRMLCQINDVGDFINEVENNNPNDKTCFSVMVDGKKKWFQTDPTIVNAVNNMRPESVSLFWKLISYPVKLLRAGATFLSPEFVVRNPFRDYVDALVYSKYGFIKPTDLIHGFVSALKMDDLYWEFQVNGGAQAGVVAIDRNYTQHSINTMMKKRSATDIVKPWKWLDYVQAFSEFSEYATRLAYFKKTKEGLAKVNPNINKSMCLQEAAFEARDLMDFARGGKSSRKWNQFAVFANASIQGWDKSFRTFNFKDPKNRKNVMAAMVRIGMYTLLPTLAFWFWNKDDDRYKNMPHWVKDTHYTFSVGDKTFRIPKGQDVMNIVVAGELERFLNYAYTKDPKALDKKLEPIKQLLPGVLPTAFMPVIEAWANYSFFKEGKIVPQYQEKLPEKMQYGPYTTSIAKWLGNKLDISPKKIDHALFGYTGSLGRIATGAYDVISGNKQLNLTMEEMPLLKGFMISPYKSSKYVNDYYDERMKQESLYNEMKTTGKRPEGFDPVAYRKFKKSAPAMQRLSKIERTIINNANLSIEEKKKKQEEIQKRRIEIVKKVMKIN